MRKNEVAHVDDPTKRAHRALSLVQGLLDGDPAASGLLHDSFDSQEDAADSFAYLAGFLLEILAEWRHEPPASTVRYVRDLLA